MNERNRCGSCTMCCKIVGVRELNKSPGRWCEYCDIGQGCAIYDDRPTSCATFQCMFFSNEWMPDEWRPDRSKVVLEGLEDRQGVVAMVDPGRPDAWKEGPIAGAISFFVRDKGVSVMVTHGIPRGYDDAIFVLAKGSTQEDFMRSVEQTALNQINREAEKSGRPFGEVLAEATRVDP